MNILKISLLSLFFLLLNFLNYFYFFQKMMIFLTIFFVIIFFTSIALCLTIFNGKKYNNILKNRLILVIIAFPLCGILFYLIWEIINQKKDKYIKKKFSPINVRNFDWKNVAWPKNNCIFGFNSFKKMKDFFEHAKKIILLQVLTHNDYEFLANNGLIELLIDIAKTKKVKIFINHNSCFKTKKIKKCKNLNIFFNNISIPFSAINSHNVLVIIDDNQALYGNFNNSFDCNFVVNGKIVNALKTCFFSWINEKSQHDQNILLELPTNNFNAIESHVQYFGMTLNLNTILLDLIYTAKKSIKIFSNYFFPSNSIKLSLQFAIEKNIDVKIITSNLSNFLYAINFSLNKSLFEEKNLWWETAKKINNSFIIIDDDIVFLTNNFNCDSALSPIYPIFWFNFRNKKNYFLKIFDDAIKNCSPIKRNKSNFIMQIKKVFYLIIYPFIL